MPCPWNNPVREHWLRQRCAREDFFCGRGRSSSEWAVGGCQSESCSETLRTQCGEEDGVGRRKTEWTDCVQSDIRAFGISGDWKTMALKAEVWVEAVRRVGGGSWPRGGKKKSKTRPDIVRRRRERQRDWESCNRTRKRRILRSDTRWPI